MTPEPDQHSLLDHPSIDAERAANAFQMLGVLAREMAAALGRANSHYQWFIETASWLLARAESLRRPQCPAVAATSPAGLHLVV